MNRREIAAYNAGVNAVLDLASAASAALTPRITEKPTRFNFAIGALDGLATEGKALLIALPTPASLEDPR